MQRAPVTLAVLLVAAWFASGTILRAQYSDADERPVVAPRRNPVPRSIEPAAAVEPAPRRISKSPSGKVDEASSEPRPRSTSSPWAVGGPLVLLLVVVLAGATLWKRHGPGVTPGLPRDAVDVLGRRPLDPRTTLWLVRLGSKILVLGVSPAGVENLTEVSDPVEVDLLAGMCKRPAAGESYVDTFRTLFQRADDARPVPSRGRTPQPKGADRTPIPEVPPEEAFARRFQRQAQSPSGEEDFRVA